MDNKLRNFTLRELGAERLQEAVLKDLDQLALNCKSKNFVPLYLIVGKLFIELSCVQDLVKQFNVLNWDNIIDNDLSRLSTEFNKSKLNLLNAIHEYNGEYSIDPITSLKIFYDPDEEYFSLICADPSKKAASDQRATKDGFAIYRLSFTDGEILPDYVSKLD